MAPNMEVTFYTCASKQSHHEVVTEKSVSAVCYIFTNQQALVFPVTCPHFKCFFDFNVNTVQLLLWETPAVSKPIVYLELKK